MLKVPSPICSHSENRELMGSPRNRVRTRADSGDRAAPGFTSEPGLVAALCGLAVLASWDLSCEAAATPGTWPDLMGVTQLASWAEDGDWVLAPDRLLARDPGVLGPRPRAAVLGVTGPRRVPGVLGGPNSILQTFPRMMIDNHISLFLTCSYEFD